MRFRHDYSSKIPHGIFVLSPSVYPRANTGGKFNFFSRYARGAQDNRLSFGFKLPKFGDDAGSAANLLEVCHEKINNKSGKNLYKFI